jgi:hypothetical protein
MTEAELRTLIAELVTEEFDKHTEEGMLPVNTDQTQVQFLFDLVVQTLFENVTSNPQLKAKLPNATREDVEGFMRRTMEESDRITRDRLNMAYRK